MWNYFEEFRFSEMAREGGKFADAERKLKSAGK